MFQMDITSGFIRWSVKVRYDVPTPKIHPKIKVSVGSNNFPKIIFRIILTWQPVFMISQVWARLEYHLHIKTLGEFVIFLDIKFFLGVIFSNYSQHIVTVGAASI
jgi:hypothetical protein